MKKDYPFMGLSLLFKSFLLISHAQAATPLTNNIALQNATATFTQNGFLPEETIDGNLSITGSDGWATLSQEETIVWETAQNAGAGGPFSYHFRLSQDTISLISGFIKNFRISYTTADRSTFANAGPGGVVIGTNWTPITTYLGLSSDTSGYSLSASQQGLITSTRTSSAPTDTSAETNGYYDLLANIDTGTRSGITGFRLDVITAPGDLGPGHSPGSGNFILREIQITNESIPEPSSALLGACGLLTLLLRRSRS